VLIDLARMNAVVVDPETKNRRCARRRALGGRRRETQAFGLVAPGGIVSDTGVAGLTLAAVKDGPAEARIVVRQPPERAGRMPLTDRRAPRHPTRTPIYFGQSAAAVGTSVSPRPSRSDCNPHGPINAFAGVFYPVEQAAQVWRGFRDWAATAPDEVTAMTGCTTLPASEHTPPQIHEHRFIVVGCRLPTVPRRGHEGAAAVARAGYPVTDITQPMPFAPFSRRSTSSSGGGTLRTIGSPHS